MSISQYVKPVRPAVKCHDDLRNNWLRGNEIADFKRLSATCRKGPLICGLEIRFLRSSRILLEQRRAQMLFPMRVGGSVLLPRALKPEDENRRRHAEIAQRLEREVRSNIPTRVMRGFCTLEGLRMPTAKTGVCRHDSRRQRARFDRSRAVAPFSIIRERLGASRLPSLRSALRGLDPPGALPTLANIGATGRSRDFHSAAASRTRIRE
jgi:hypothetical protein